MTPARPRGAGSALARWYVGWKVRRFFRGVWVRGEVPPGDGSVLVYANHPGFWDGFVLHELAVAWGREPFCLVEEQNLVRFPFLARLGAFSIRPGDPRSTIESFRYARALLSRPRTAVFLFPQGRLTPLGAGPPCLHRGAEVLARRSGATCVPVALRYAFFESEHPDALLEVGAVHPPVSTAELTRRLGALVSEVEQRQGLAGYRSVVRGTGGASARWAWLKHQFGRGARGAEW